MARLAHGTGDGSVSFDLQAGTDGNADALLTCCSVAISDAL